jgi:DNA-binding transcriptional LysR family regulator
MARDLTTSFAFCGVALTGYEVDILIKPDPTGAPGIQYRPVFDYEFFLTVPVNHPLPAKQNTASVRDPVSGHEQYNRGHQIIA